MTKLTPDTFDGLTRAPAREERIIWTAGGIARRLGCGEDYVRKTLATLAQSPIRRKGRRLYVFEEDLIRFMRNGGGN